MQLEPLQQKSESPWIFGIGFVIALVAAGAILFSLFTIVFRSPSSDESSSIVPEQPTLSRRALDGVMVADTQAHNRLIAVLVDNMEEARPMTGIKQAPLVFDVPVEGGITRFLAVYDRAELPDTIGPVRSLRPYFIEWASSVDALLLHVGGSPEALELARTAPVDRLNQFFDSQYFWRSAERSAPFNVYTSRALLDKAFRDRSLRMTSALADGVFAEEVPSTATEHSSIDIQYSTESYHVQWVWDAGAGVWKRFVGGAPFVSDGEQVGAKNVIVQWTPIEVLDQVGRRRIATTGSGRAMIARDGRTIEGTWKREAGQRTRYVDVNGNEIALAPGNTWVQVVRDTLTVNVQ